MKVFVINFILGLIALGTSAQSQFNSLDYSSTAAGLQYRITTSGEGRFPQSGDRLWVHYMGFLENDSLFSSSLESGPLDFYLGEGAVIKGWDEGLRFLKPGGSMVLKIPPELAYGNVAYPGIPANATLYFEISLLQIDKGLFIQPFNIDGADSVTLPNGLKYYTIEQGEGPTAKEGDNAYIHYAAYLKDTSLFDSSRKKGEAVRIAVGKSQVIEGWDLAIQQMNEGAKLKVIIPPKLAYGIDGYGNIVPPNATVSMDLEMVKLSPEIKVKQWEADTTQSIELTSGLKCFVVQSGQGELIVKESIVSMHYTGYLTSGKIIDSSVKREEEFVVPAGIGAIIEGWDTALMFMKKGGKYQLYIPASLAYGKEGYLPEIPANADLIYDIEIIDVF